MGKYLSICGAFEARQLIFGKGSLTISVSGQAMWWVGAPEFHGHGCYFFLQLLHFFNMVFPLPTSVKNCFDGAKFSRGATAVHLPPAL